MSYSLTYGGTSLAETSYKLVIQDAPTRPGMADPRLDEMDLGGADGSHVRAATRKASSMMLQCYIRGDDKQDLIECFDAVKAVLDPSAGEQLLILDQETGIDAAVNRGYYAILNGPIQGHLVSPRMLRFQLAFRIPLGCAVAVNETNQTITVDETPETATVPAAGNVGGTTVTPPVWTLTVSSGRVTALWLENVTRDETFRWAGTLLATHKLRIDSERKAVEQSTDGGTTWTNAMSGMAVGAAFPALTAGAANTVRVTGCGDGSLGVVYRARFL